MCKVCDNNSIVCETLNAIATVTKAFVWRSIGIIDLIVGFFGFRPEKFLRIKVFILTAEKTKSPVVDLSVVEEWVEFTKEAYSSKMNVSVRATDLRGGNNIIEVISDPVPSDVLDIKAGFTEYYGSPTGFLSSLQEYTHTSTWDYIFDFIGYKFSRMAKKTLQVQVMPRHDSTAWHPLTCWANSASLRSRILA